MPDLSGQIGGGNSAVLLAQDPPAGTMVGPGVYNVSMTAFDLAGNPTTCATMLSVSNGMPLAITYQPQNQTNFVGSNAVFSVGAQNQMGYQWRFNGQNLAGATTSIYVVTNAQATNAGSYSVVVSNACGSITSQVATLTLLYNFNPQSSATLLQPAFVGGSNFQFLLTGQTGANYAIFTSTNLAGTNWVPLRTNPAPFWFTDTNVSRYPQRFYRGLYTP